MMFFFLSSVCKQNWNVLPTSSILFVIWHCNAHMQIACGKRWRHTNSIKLQLMSCFGKMKTYSAVHLSLRDGSKVVGWDCNSNFGAFFLAQIQNHKGLFIKMKLLRKIFMRLILNSFGLFMPWMGMMLLCVRLKWKTSKLHQMMLIQCNSYKR